MKEEKKKTPDPDRLQRGDERIPESARRLRELYERGMAELAERQKIDPHAR